jgi:hypothetical protein
MSFFNQWYNSNGKKFYNIWQAFDYQKETGTFPEYKLDDDFINLIKNIKKPKNLDHNYIKNLIVRRLKELREKYKYLRLALGGGTDSWSILKYCIEYDIYVDEVFTQMNTIKVDNIKSNIEYLPSILYAEKFVGKNIGKVLRLHSTIEDWENYLIPDWYKDPNFIRGNHLPGRWCIPCQFYKKTDLPLDQCVTIHGLDKPLVQNQKGKLYWTQLDTGISEIMGVENILPLFFDKGNPELTVAMTYGLLDNSDTTKEYIAYDTQPKNKKLRILNAMGLVSTGHHFLDFHLLGKYKFDFQNYKNRLARKEIIQLGRKDIIDEYFRNMKSMILQYKDLSHGIEIKDKIYLKTINRLSQKVPIYQDSFGS